MNKVIKIIDTEAVIKNSTSKFIRSLPGFIIRFIRKIVHQDEMNETIHKFRDKEGVPFINEVLKEWKVNIVVNGGENIPVSGRFVFVSNHPLGGIDALAFFSTVYRYHQNLISPSNELFNYIPQLKPVILGINVFGKNTKETAEKINLLFESGAQILIFPAGEVSRRKSGMISDPLWQKTFITKAIQYERDIIPVFISGRNSNLFYFVANLRKLLGLKLYIETLLLPREMMKQKKSEVTLTIGKPVQWDKLTGEKSHSEWAQCIKEIVYNLNKK
jgi:putative hemolysin